MGADATPIDVEEWCGLSDARGHSPNGGAASRAEGWLIAMGGTEEAQRVAVLGADARGSEADGDHNRFDGTGHVKSTRDKAQYSSARSKGHGVTLITTENSGAISRDFNNTLHHYGKLATALGTTDSTVYGASRASTRSYYQHHVAAIAAAIVFADVSTIHATGPRTSAPSSSQVAPRRAPQPLRSGKRARV